MGWDSSARWKSKRQVVDETIQEYRDGGFTIIGQASTRQGAYIGVRSTTGETFIIAMLIKRWRGEYWLKTMSEHVGPYMDDCPADLLAKVPMPPNSKYARDFRERCAARLRDRTAV